MTVSSPRYIRLLMIFAQSIDIRLSPSCSGRADATIRWPFPSASRTATRREPQTARPWEDNFSRFVDTVSGFRVRSTLIFDAGFGLAPQVFINTLACTQARTLSFNATLHPECSDMMQCKAPEGAGL